MKANKIIFKIREDGNGYGHLFGEFKIDNETINKEFAMVSLCDDRDIVETIVLMVNKYNSTLPPDISSEQYISEEQQVRLLIAESEMRRAESIFINLQNTLCKKEL